MDTALLLRMKFDRGEPLSSGEIDDLLAQSKVVQKLTEDYEENALFNIFRFLCLAEIPYVERLPYTQKVIAYISDRLSLPDGFSYTGNVNDIVPCYNAMLLEAYTRLGQAASPEAQNALNWIKRYQVFERNQSTAWKNNGICKHGGCMNAVPCYIGIGKTVKALITYAGFTGHTDREVEALIEKGAAYMLRHNLYRRLSNNAPISPHITDIMFPQAYMLTVTDLVYIAGKRKLWKDNRTHALKELLDCKACDADCWKIDYIYSHKGYKAFDGKRKASEWIGYLFRSSLSDQSIDGGKKMLEKIPNDKEMAALVGQSLYDVWTKLCVAIDERYEMDRLWNSGGKAWTYEYKYRRGGKTLCALYAKENCVGLMIIFGKEEREKFEANRQNYAEATQRIYDEAKTYHDGKWVMFEPVDTSMFDDFIRLLQIKRKPNRQ